MKILFCPHCGFRFVKHTYGPNNESNIEAIYECPLCPVTTWITKNHEVWTTIEPKLNPDADIHTTSELITEFLNEHFGADWEHVLKDLNTVCFCKDF